MPKPRHKLKKRESLVDDQSSDITLNAFANSTRSIGCNRVKKSAIQHVTTDIKLLNVTDDDRAWDEKLEDLADDGDDTEEPKKIRKKKKKSSESSNSDDGVDYPLDVWYLISDYLEPEAIGTFAAICKSSNAVVNSAKFWFCLYKRFYREIDGIPETLKPGFMARRYGLRPLVIRSLYYTYPRFAENVTRPELEVQSLVGRICTESWCRKIKGKSQWLYNFTLKLPSSPLHGRKKTKRKPDLLEMLDDINANAYEGCKQLQIRAKSYYPMLILGQTLRDIQTKNSRDFSSFNLTLVFSSGPSGYQAIPVYIQKVVNFRTCDWWHPAFSHTEKLHSGLISSLLPNEEFV